MERTVAQSLDEEAVAHAQVAERAGDLSWAHIYSEYTQDPPTIAETLATGVPLAWTLALPSDADGGAYRFRVGTTKDEVRQRYEELRQSLEIHGWEPLLEIRTGWYTMSQGISTLKMVPSGETTKGETVVMFPVGTDGILGELQVGTVGRLPDGRAPVDEDRLPLRRMAVLAEHDDHMAALRAEDVEAIVAAHVPDAAVAVRSYLTDESSLLHVVGSASIRAYYDELFTKYRVLDVQLVNRVAETWYVFAELHWTVEERTGAGRTLEFCTADLASIDSDRRYWVRTGAGTDPVVV
ncbi:MAG TPA: nuclear transport factor 2 family protein [Acidimicrobiales bacterium]